MFLASRYLKRWILFPLRSIQLQTGVYEHQALSCDDRSF